MQFNIALNTTSMASVHRVPVDTILKMGIAIRKISLVRYINKVDSVHNALQHIF